MEHLRLKVGIIVWLVALLEAATCPDTAQYCLGPENCHHCMHGELCCGKKCDGQKEGDKIACRIGETIEVKNVHYGCVYKKLSYAARKNVSGMKIQLDECNEPKYIRAASYETVVSMKTRCDGEVTCDAFSGRDVPSDACGDNGVTTDMRGSYICQKEPVSECPGAKACKSAEAGTNCCVNRCDGYNQTKTIDCDPEEVIDVIGLLFGCVVKLGTKDKYEAGLTDTHANCPLPDYLVKVPGEALGNLEEMCDDKVRCELPSASTYSVFGQGCPSAMVQKSLRVTYRCIAALIKAEGPCCTLSIIFGVIMVVLLVGNFCFVLRKPIGRTLRNIGDCMASEGKNSTSGNPEDGL